MNSFIKKIYVMAAALLFSVVLYPSLKIYADDGWVHSAKPYDYKTGLLNDEYIIKSHNLHEYMYDDDLENEANLHSSDEYFIDFIQPVNIKGAYINLRRLYSATTFYFSDGNIKSLTAIDGENYYDLDYKDIIKITFSKGTNGSAYIKEIDFFGSYQKDSYPPVEILNIKQKEKEIEVKFKKPEAAQAVDVWLNNQKIERVNTDVYTYQNLMPDTDYELMFLSYYGDDKYGTAVRQTVRTKKSAVGEVENLKVQADSHKQVNLNWSNPNQSSFSHVTIYRDIAKDKGFLNYIGLGLIRAKAEDITKLFETNGTYFIDHSVAASTKYEYLVTTTDDEGKESKGVSKSVTTPKKQNPDPPKSEIEEQENGDYLVTWTSPTEGKVLIKIDGKDYVTVNASTGSYLIPVKDMVYDWLNNPKVQVIAIDIDGDESNSTKPGPPGSTENGGSGGIGGFGDLEGIKAKDVLSGTMSFIKLLGPLIILGLIIYFVPRLIRVIKQSINQKRDYNR